MVLLKVIGAVLRCNLVRGHFLGLHKSSSIPSQPVHESISCFPLSRFSSALLVVSSGLLAAERCRHHLHPRGARTLHRRRDHRLLHHDTAVLVVPFHGQRKGESREDPWVSNAHDVQGTRLHRQGF